MNFCKVSRVKKKKTSFKRGAFAQPINLLIHSDILRWWRFHEDLHKLRVSKTSFGWFFFQWQILLYFPSCWLQEIKVNNHKHLKTSELKKNEKNIFQRLKKEKKILILCPKLPPVINHCSLEPIQKKTYICNFLKMLNYFWLAQ